MNATDISESAVPTLKVMRLQKPELHTPSAGTLEANCLLSSAMCLPDSFGVIHVGETFTAYLGALNVSKSLHVTRLTVTAQLQTPSQRWHLSSSLDAGNAEGGVNVPPESGIDAIVSHVLEESGQHILRVEVGYGSPDGNKTLRKFYRFQVSNPLIINQMIYRAGDSSCFVTITLENNGAETKGGLTIRSAEFDAAAGLVAERVQSKPSENKRRTKFSSVQLFDECGRLETGASRRYMFKVSTSSPKLRGIAAGDELGKAVVTWHKACGEMGRMASVPLICPGVDPVLDMKDPEAIMEGRGNPFVLFVQGSALPVDVAAAAASRANATPTMNMGDSLDQIMPVTVEPIDPPRNVTLGEPFCVTFSVVNHSEKYMTLQLQFRLDHMGGLSVCGPSFKNLDEVPGSGGSVSVSIRFMALTAGLLQLRGCCVADLATGLTIPQPPLFKTLVVSEKQ